MPETGFAWINFFLLYVSLPALFFGIMAQTPFEELNNPPFVIATTLGTAIAFLLAAVVGHLVGRLSLREARWPGSPAPTAISVTWARARARDVRRKAAAPTALIFCCDSIFLFSIVPLMIELTDREHASLPHALGSYRKQIVLHPLIMSACPARLLRRFISSRRLRSTTRCYFCRTPRRRSRCSRWA